MKNKDEDEELRWIDEDDSDGTDEADSSNIHSLGRGRAQRQRGVELESVPLCAWCDNATDGLYKAEILDMGLQNVTKSDGGLSRSRLDMLRRTKYKDPAPLRQTTRSLTKGQSQVQNSEHGTEAGANLLAGAGDFRIGECGDADGISNCSSPADTVSSMLAPVYVSVLDAIGEPSFRASKTKPVPRWMILPPSKWRPTFEKNGAVMSSLEARIPAHGLTSTVPEELAESHTPLGTSTTVPGAHSHTEMNYVANITPHTAVVSKTEDATTFEPAISKDAQVDIPNYDTVLDYRASHPQRSTTPYPFGWAVCRPSVSLGIPRSSFLRQVAATTTPARHMPENGGTFSILSSQLASPLVSREGKLTKRDVPIEEEPIVERFKRQKTEGAIVSGGGKNGSGEGALEDVPVPGYVDRRDELRRELLSLFNGRREPSREP